MRWYYVLVTCLLTSVLIENNTDIWDECDNFGDGKYPQFDTDSGGSTFLGP